MERLTDEENQKLFITPKIPAWRINKYPEGGGSSTVAEDFPHDPKGLISFQVQGFFQLTILKRVEHLSLNFYFLSFLIIIFIIYINVLQSNK